METILFQWFRWVKSADERAVRLVVVPDCPFKDALGSPCCVSTVATKVRERGFGMLWPFHLKVKVYYCSTPGHEIRFDILQEHAVKGRPDDVCMDPFDLAVTNRSAFSLDLLRHLLRQSFVGRLSVKANVQSVRELWLQNMEDRLNAALAMVRALGDDESCVLEELKWSGRGGWQVIAQFGKDLLGALIKHWFRHFVQPEDERQTVIDLDNAGVRISGDATYGILRGLGGYTFQCGKKYFRLAPNLKSLFSLMDEYTTVLFTEIMPNDRMEHVCRRLQQLWRIQKEKPMVKWTRVYFTDNVFAHNDMVVAAWEAVFGVKASDPHPVDGLPFFLVLQDLFHARDRVGRTLNKRSPGYRAMFQELCAVIRQFKTKEGYPTAEAAKAALRTWLEVSLSLSCTCACGCWC